MEPPKRTPANRTPEQNKRRKGGGRIVGKLTFKRPQNNRKSLDNIRNTHKGKLAVALTEEGEGKDVEGKRRTAARGSDLGS